MKILKFLFKFLLVLVGLFLLSGLVFPKVSYQTSEKINKPLEPTFNLHNDVDQMLKWRTGLQSIQTLEKKPGTVGNKYKVVIDAQGSFMQMKRIVNTYKLNQKVEHSTQSDEMIKIDQYFYQFSDNQTIINQKTSIEGKTYFLKCLYASFWWMMKWEDVEVLESFKEFAEVQ